MIQIKHFVIMAAILSITLISCVKDVVILNQVPIANAGPSKTITMDVDTLTLSGSGKDTDGQVVAYLWSQVSGPVVTTIVNPGSPSTLVQGLAKGTYEFQLMVVDDKGATGVDTTTVVVNPSAVQTLTLQPDNNPNEFEYVIVNNIDQSGKGGPDIPVSAWTLNSDPLTVREAIKFDLSSIPSNATITSATLYLYSYPSPTVSGNLTDANFGDDNTLLVQQITSNWSPSTANWFNQPGVLTTNEIVVPSTTESVLDLNLDVTPLVSSMVDSSANYGFFLRLQNEVAYSSRIFVSSYNTTYPDKHPKLVVVYKD